MASTSIESVVEMLRSMRERDAAYAVAESLSELLAGEESGLVDPGSWRPEIDVEETERFLAGRTDEVLARWDRELATLKQWFGHRLLYEEVLMFLTRRSGLESVARYVDEPRREQLAATDEGFAETLRLNTNPVRSARNAPRGAIMTRLPAHWWWRGGPDAGATPPP